MNVIKMDPANIEVQLNLDEDPKIVKNKTSTGYWTMCASSSPDSKKATLVYEPPLKHSPLNAVRGDNTKISGMTTKIECLKKPPEYYMCSDLTHREKENPECAACKEAKKRKEEEPRFKLIEAIEKIDNVVKDFLDLKNIPKDKMARAMQIRNSIISVVGVDVPDGIPVSKMLFVPSIQQPKFNQDQMKYDTKITPEMIGKPDYSKSPIFTARLWEDKIKTGEAAEAERQKEIETKGKKNYTPLNTKIYIEDTGPQIYTIIEDYTNKTHMPRQLKTWQEIDDFLVYEKGDAKTGKKKDFELISSFEFLVPMFVFDSGKKVRLRWTIRKMKVGTKLLKNRSKEPSLAEAQSTYKLFEDYESEFTDDQRNASVVTQYQEYYEDPQDEKSDELSNEEKQMRKRKQEGGEVSEAKRRKLANVADDDDLSSDERNQKKRKHEGGDDSDAKRKKMEESDSVEPTNTAM